MSNLKKQLDAAALEAGRIFAASGEEFYRKEIPAYDLGVLIPASTMVRVTFEVLHTPDPERTPELEMEMEFNPT